MTPYFVKPVVRPDGEPMLVEIPLPINNEFGEAIMHALAHRSNPQHRMCWSAILEYVEEQADRFVEDMPA